MRPGDVVADRFEIERLVGSGGMGAVYRACDRESGESVALKLLHGSEVEDEIRFAREGRVLAELRHPGIVQHVAHGVTKAGEPYLAMEWIEGEDLAQRLWRSSLRVEEIVALGRKVAEALGAAHALGVVHRDIKPSNLLLPDGQIDRVKVVDFGIARFAGAQPPVTRTGRVLGTLAYLAPEQARGDRIQGARVDVFALGCVLFECLTGRVPFEGRQAVTMLAKLVLEDAPRAGEVRAGVPEGLDRLLVRMLCRDPEGRPEGGAEVAAELAALELASLSKAPPPSADPPSLSRREQRLVALIAAEVEATGAVCDRVRAAVEPFEARVERLDDGSLGVTLAGSGSAVDQITHAARCALALRGLLGGTRMALSSGPAVLRGRVPMGSLVARARDLLRAAEALGAARSILVDEVSAGLLEPRFEIEGISLVGERDEVESSRRLLVGIAPLVGRDREIHLLLATLDDTIHASTAAAVLVTGPPGTGKSRLRAEMVDRFRRRGDNITVHTAEGAPLAAESPRRAVIDLCRAARGDRGLEGEGPEWALHEIVAAASPARPVVIVLDDLQWIDRPSIQLIDAALREARDKSLLVCAFGRPEVHDALPRVWAERNVHEIRLGDLTRRSSERLIRAALGVTSPREIERIAEIGAGNPLCLRELCRAARAGRGDELPETVVAIALGRIAALPPEDRRLLRAASLLGEAFTAPALAALLGEPEAMIEGRLGALVDREVVVRRGEACAFQQALIRQGAYRMLTDEDRALGERLAGRSGVGIG